MTQSRRTIESLIQQGTLPSEHADAAALHLEVFPTKKTWLAFFDKAALIIGSMALVLSLVFFIAYNWLNMGKLGKFALVEGALIISILAYIYLVIQRQLVLVQQLLLLVASIITGSLLALFGQVYQTGADTWQLFAGWAALITPWVIIARFPALWLLWLGLINALTLLYIDTSIFASLDAYYQDFWQSTLITVINFLALYLWLFFFENKRLKHQNASLHWSTYAVGLLSTGTITRLTIMPLFDNQDTALFQVSILLWLGWAGFILWRFKKHHIDLLMLTYLCGSVIALIVFISGKALLRNFNPGGFLLLGFVLIGSSSCAVVWLRNIARFTDQNHTKSMPPTAVKGSQRRQS